MVWGTPGEAWSARKPVVQWRRKDPAKIECQDPSLGMASLQAWPELGYSELKDGRKVFPKDCGQRPIPIPVTWKGNKAKMPGQEHMVYADAARNAYLPYAYQVCGASGLNG